MRLSTHLTQMNMRLVAARLVAKERALLEACVTVNNEPVSWLEALATIRNMMVTMTDTTRERKWETYSRTYWKKWTNKRVVRKGKMVSMWPSVKNMTHKGLASSKRQPHLQTELKAVVNTLPTWDAKRILVQLISTIELKVVWTTLISGICRPVMNVNK